MAVERPLLSRPSLFPAPRWRDSVLRGAVLIAFISALILGSGVARQQLPLTMALAVWGQLVIVTCVLAVVSAQVLVLCSRMLDGVREREAPPESSQPEVSPSPSGARRRNMRDRSLVSAREMSAPLTPAGGADVSSQEPRQHHP